MNLEFLEHLRNIWSFASPIVAIVGLYFLHLNMVKQKKFERQVGALERAFMEFWAFARKVQIHKLKIESWDYERIPWHDLYGDDDLEMLDRANRLVQLYAPKNLAKRTQYVLESFKKHEYIDVENEILYPLRRYIREMLREERLSSECEQFNIGWYGSLQEDSGIKKIEK